MFNSVDYIERCVNSIIDQSLPSYNFDVIIVDDASIDTSSRIIESLYSKFPNIHLIQHAENKGVAASRNTGILASSSRYLYFLDSDDYIHPDTLLIMYKAIELMPHCQYLYSDYVFVDNNEQKSSQINAKESPIACASLIRKSLFIKLGLYKEMRIGEEKELFSRLNDKNIIKEHIPIALYRYRQHDMGITADFRKRRLYDS